MGLTDIVEPVWLFGLASHHNRYPLCWNGYPPGKGKDQCESPGKEEVTGTNYDSRRLFWLSCSFHPCKDVRKPLVQTTAARMSV